MNKVYVVCGQSGDYSLHTEWSVCAYLTEARAKEVSDRLNKALKLEASLRDRLHSEFEEPYRKKHKEPEPSVISKEYWALIQSVNTGKAPEEEKLAFRAARKAYEAENRTYMEANTAFYMAQDVARKEWLAGNTPPEIEWARATDNQRGSYSGYVDDYNYYELEVRE